MCALKDPRILLRWAFKKKCDQFKKKNIGHNI